LVDELKQAVTEATTFCIEHGVELEAIQAAEGFERVKLLDDAVDAILVNDQSRERYLLLAGNVSKLYKAILPDPQANELAPTCILLEVIARKMRSLTPPPDISEVMREVDKLLDESIAAQGYVIETDPYGTEHLVDLSKIDFEALRAKFERSRKHIETETLKGTIMRKLKRMVRLNRTRMDYLEQFQKMIDEYNAGSMNVEEFFKQLIAFAQSLDEEEQRSIAEQLSEEELAIFDLLTKPDMRLSEQERQQVKKVARELLETLEREKLVLDWRKRQQSRAGVRLAIEQILDKLPQCFTQKLYQLKCDLVYQHIYDSYYGLGQSVYSLAV